MKSSSLFLSTLAASLLCATAAMALPTTTIDGITIPDDSNGAGAVFTIQNDAETQIVNVGDQLSGVGMIQSIQAPGSTGQIYFNGLSCSTVGCSGTFLTDVFNGLTVREIDPVFVKGVQTGNEVYLTGGTLDWYVLNAFPNLNTGSQATDTANAMSSTLFLSMAPAVIDSNNDTMTIFVPGDSLDGFTGTAQGNADLNVTGGDAASIFDTNTFPTGYNNTVADLTFVGNASEQSGLDFPVGGSDDLRANTVPEPASLALLGAGLFIVSWSLRRRASRSKQ